MMGPSKSHIFFIEYFFRQEQGHDHPGEIDDARKQNPGFLAQEIFVHGAGITHQGADIHFKHDKYPPQVNGIEGGKQKSEFFNGIVTQ